MASRWSSRILMTLALFASGLSQAEDSHKQPLWFKVEGHGVTIEEPRFDWDLEKRDSLFLGPFELSSQKFFAMALKNSKLGLKPTNQYTLLLFWPQALVFEGQAQILDRSGQTLWESQFSEVDFEIWQRTRDEILTNSSLSESSKSFLSKATLGFLNISESAEFFTEDLMRLCLNSRHEKGQVTLCSSQIFARFDNTEWKLLPAEMSTKPAEVFIQGRQAPLKGSVKPKLDREFKFSAQTKDGISYSFSTKPQKINLADMVQNDDETLYLITGVGPRPLRSSIYFRRYQTNFFERVIRWEPTIGDLQLYWQTEMRKDEPPDFMISGEYGGVFRQTLKIERVPKQIHRPFISKSSVTSTYFDNAKIFGYRPQQGKLSTQENSIEFDEDEPGEFLWRFKAEKSNDYNRSLLLIQDGSEQYAAYYDLYKTYANELSLRLSLVLATEFKILLMNEISLNNWYQSILGWQNSHLSLQRWGTSVKHFRSLTPFKFNGFEDTFRTTTADLKYRLTPGTWGREETWGLIAGLQKAEYADFSPTMVGGGFFWARSMPRLFDDLFNLVPILRYPKWVDLEFIYYLQSLTPDTSLTRPPEGTGNWALNFRGKIYWSRRFFGEAGFGVKQYDFARSFDQPTFIEAQGRNVRRLGLNLTTFYGNFGIGMNF